VLIVLDNGLVRVYVGFRTDLEAALVVLDIDTCAQKVVLYCVIHAAVEAT
jgi:hypothetical protein